MSLDDLLTMGFSQECLDEMSKITEQIRNHSIPNDINFKPYLTNKLYNFILTYYPQNYGTYAISLVNNIVLSKSTTYDKFYEIIYLIETNPQKMNIYKEIMDILIRMDFINNKVPGINTAIDYCLKNDYDAFGGDC